MSQTSCEARNPNLSISNSNKIPSKTTINYKNTMHNKRKIDISLPLHQKRYSKNKNQTIQPIKTQKQT